MRPTPIRLISRAAAMLLTVLMVFAGAAEARAQQTETVSFTDENGVGKTVFATMVTADMEIFGYVGGTTWYFVKEEITHNGPIYCFGNVNFILGFNGTMKIYVNDDEELQAVDISGNLTIYDEVEGQGYFYVESHNKYGCISGGSLAVHGGYVRAVTCNYTAIDPAIEVTDVTVSDGTLIAWTFNSLSAIYANNGITISGGYVNALTENTSSQAKAITANNGITVSGGTLDANGRNGYGIISNNVNISGGTVTTSGSFGIYGLSGTINLAWTNTTDRFKAGRCARAITIADGKYFKDDSGNIYYGTLTDAQKSAIVNVELQPAAEGEYNAYVFAASDDGNTYTIRNADGWNLFCDVLDGNGGKSFFCGKTVKLAADIGSADTPVTRRAGSADHDFTGHFDGQGHTLYVRLGTAEAPLDVKAAPFQNVTTVNSVAASIENLRVCGDIYASDMYAGGIIGSQYGDVTLRNCRSSVNIHSSATGDTSTGGLVGNGHDNLKIEGCLFDGSLTAESADAVRCAGFVGYYGSTATLSVSNSLVAPASVTIGTGTGGTISATFSRLSNNGTITIANGYYATDALGTTQGKQRRSIKADGNVTVGHAGEATTYGVSGITAYKESNESDTFTAGLLYNNVLYAGEEDEVCLELTNTPPTGYVFNDYTVSPDEAWLYEVGDNYTLSMPDVDVTIGANFSMQLTTETIALSAGWNWFSPSCDISLDDLKAALVEALSGTSITIQSKTQNTTYNPRTLRWTGSISWDVAQMYMIQVNADCDITLEGYPIAPGEHPVIIAEGDNGIGFPFAQNMSVANAFAGFAMNSDVIISQTSSACYSNGAWKGTLKILEPGQGYIYKSAISGTRILAYPDESGADSCANDSFDGDSHWSDFNYHSYQYNRPFVAAIKIDGQYVTADDYDLNGMEVAAFVGEECRGNRFTLTNHYVENGGEPYPVLGGMPVYYYTSGQEVTFQLYANGIEYTDCEILYDGVATEIYTGEDHVEGWMNPENPIILSFTSPAVDLVLSDTGANAEAIEQNHNRRANVTLQGRKLWKDGAWNTLCLPFSIADIEAEGCPLKGATVRELSDASISGTTLTLNFKAATTAIDAGVPYIVKWINTESTEGTEYTEDPVFRDVTVSTVCGDYDTQRLTAPESADYDEDFATDERVRFIGTYDQKTIDTEDKSILFLGAANTLYYPQPDIDPENPENSKYPTIGAQRAYFKIGEDGEQARALTEFNIDFGDGSEAQGITTTDYTDLTDKAAAWYTLDGVRLDGKPTKKGLYIHRGRMVVIP